MESTDHRKYVDVATQTSPFTSPLIAPACLASPITSFFTATSLPIPAHSTLRKPQGDNHASADEFVRSGESAKHQSDILSPHLPSLPSSFGLQSHTGVRSLHPINRTVSLPESLCDEDLRLVLSQLIENSPSESRAQTRVVSMPEPAHLDMERPSSPDTVAYPESDGSSLEMVQSGDENYDGGEEGSLTSSSPSTPRTIVMHSLSSDQFHTPSPPPSSCDSVEFTLDDPIRLPRSFLRGSVSPPIFVPAIVNKAASLLEDDGWLTWANSPPRPIPALHGPSSLPYARCPSGAEGTIIGEPSSLPRMIWGLDPNDTLPTPHLPHQQQSRAVPIKPPSVKQSRRGSLQAPVSVDSTPATFTLPSLGPGFGFNDMDYHSFEERQNGARMSASVSAGLGPRLEERSGSGFRRMTRGGAGLGFSVGEEDVQLGTRYETGMRDGDPVMRSSQFYSLQMPNLMDGDIEMLSVQGEAERQRQLEVQIQEERYGFAARGLGTRGGHPSDLIDLFPSPVKLPIHLNPPVPSIASRFASSDSMPGYLPTPPNSSSPQWSSVFSPLKNRPFPTTNLPYSGSDPSVNANVRSKIGTTNDELSQELRRFVFENITPSNSTNAIDALRTPPVLHTPSATAFSRAHANPSSAESPIHPPGIPIPHHILLSQVPESSNSLPTQGPFPQTSAPSFTSTYTRSTLSNPRSIPLSRLRQKRGAIKLATVPEEDFSDALAHDGRLGPQPPRLSLRVPSPLPDGLQPQSVGEKSTFGQDELKVGKVRVKLPHSTNARGRDSGQSTTPQGSPKKKRLQRRKKSGVSKLAETAKGGFPLVSEGTVSFGSMKSHATQDA